MRIGRNEIIEELTEHIRQSGGEPGEWRVGTAKDATLMGKWPIQDENPAGGAGLAYREAHTTYAADDAVDYLVNAFGLQLAPEAEHCSALRLAERRSAIGRFRRFWRSGLKSQPRVQ